MGESVAEFMERRRREIAGFGRAAEAAAHEAFGKAIKTGRDLRLGSPGEVMRYGASLIAGDGRQSDSSKSPDVSVARLTTAKPAAVLAVRAPVGRGDGERTDQDGDWLNQSPTARAVGGDLARTAGNVVGV